MTEGLGLRYSLLGPFETMQLNANGSSSVLQSLIHFKVHGVILHMSILGKIDRQKEVSACIPDFSLASQTGYLAGGRFNR